MTDLALPDYSAEIERAADPAAYVIQACERAKVWLAQVLEHGEIDQIVELKSQAEAIRVYTMSKQLGQDAQLSAAEIVRRAERGIGLAVRKGQAAGEITKQGGDHRASKSNDVNFALRRASDLVGCGKTAVETYALSDGVTEDRFEAAIAEAKSEGNLSRANVVRKVRSEEAPVGRSTADVRTQIASAPAQRRALNAANTTLSGVCIGLRQIEDLHPDLTSEEAAEWVDGLSEARLVIERTIKRLKERANAQV